MGIRAAWDGLLGRTAAKAMRGGNTERPSVAGAHGGWNWGDPRDRWDLTREAGDLGANSVVSIARSWLRRQVPSAVLEVGTASTGSEWEAIEDHPLVTLLKRPNPWQSSRVLFGALTDCLTVAGYGYWLKVRDGLGQVVEVWWVPNHQIQPEWGGPRQVQFYRYTPSVGGERRIDPADIVHFRIGSDPGNPAQGCSPLAEQIRSIVGINAGERYTASVLRWAHSGKLGSPKDGTNPIDPDTPEEAEMIALSAKLGRDFGGENAGRIVMTNLPMDLHDIGNGPEAMLLDRILDRPEANICAAMGLNTLVLNLPSSAATRTYANLAEANRQAWENAVIPLQDVIAEDGIQAQLLFATDDRGNTFAEFDGTPPDALVWWNRSEVAALKEDADQRAGRATNLYAGGIATLNESRSLVDLPPVDGPEGELRYGELTPEQEAERQAQAEAMANGQGDPLALMNGRAGRNGSTADE